MSLLSFFARRTSAPVARERLQVLLAHERAAVAGQADLVTVLREEILTVIGKHVPVEREKVKVKMDRGDAVSMLAVDIEIPTPAAHAERPRPEQPKPEQGKLTRSKSGRTKSERPKAERTKPERSKSAARTDTPAEKPPEEAAEKGGPEASASPV